jgi:hypothetical protein
MAGKGGGTAEVTVLWLDGRAADPEIDRLDLAGYLGRVGIAAPEPSREALNELSRGHMCAALCSTYCSVSTRASVAPWFSSDQHTDSRSFEGRLQVILRPDTLPLRSSLGLSLVRVVTGVWVEHHRGSTRRQCAGESRAPGRTLDFVQRSA